MSSIVSQIQDARKLLMQGQAKAAIEDLAPIEMDFSSLAIVRGESYYILGNWSEAVRQFEAALRLSPNSPRAEIMLELASEMVDLTKTIQPKKTVEQLLGFATSQNEVPIFPKIAALRPEVDEPEAQPKEHDEIGLVSETLADVMIQQGKFDEARKVYIQLARLNPDRYEYFRDKMKTLQTQS